MMQTLVFLPIFLAFLVSLVFEAKEGLHLYLHLIQHHLYLHLIQHHLFPLLIQHHLFLILMLQHYLFLFLIHLFQLNQL